MDEKNQENPTGSLKEKHKETNNDSKVFSQSPQEQKKGTVGQEQIYSILFNREIGWREIIYDLINTEQLDPWDINITILADKYLKKVREFEEADFFVSSKVLFAASLLLRIKSEMLLNKYIKSIDEILFGKKEEKKDYQQEKMELEEEIPQLVPKTPMPRAKKVTLNELMDSLNKAINTENRRIKKAVINKNALRETGISLPRKKHNIKDRIKDIYNKLLGIFKVKKQDKRISLTDFMEEIGNNKKLDHFFPLLHLENQQEIWLDQKKHFDEIHIWDKKDYLNRNGDPFADLKNEGSESEETSEKENEETKSKNKKFSKNKTKKES